MEGDAMARKVEALILRRLAAVSQAAVARQCGWTESHTSRIASSQAGVKLDELGRYLEVLGLRLVDKEARLVDQDEYHALRVLARKALQDEA
jgi:hypothetical protein